MTDHDVIVADDSGTTTTTGDPSSSDTDTTDIAVFVDFLAAEFPEWQFAVDATSTWAGESRTLWIATREGHHPQSELTAGKLHRRLSDYEERLQARHPADN